MAVCDTEQVDRHLITRESFRPDGKLTERWHHNPDGPEWAVVRRYDADGRLLAEEVSGPGARMLEYRYDANGRLERVIELLADGTERVQESYLYHDDGTSTATLYVHPPLRDRNVGVSAESMLHISTDAVCIMTLRDRGDRPIRKVLYDADNRVIQRVLFRYDAAGRLLEEGEAEPGGGLRADMRNLCRYDARGRCIETEIRWGPFGGRRKDMSYTEQGDLEEERIEPLSGGIDLFGTPPWSRQFGYEYDARGNWTSRTEQIRRLDTGLVTYTGATRRTLRYWE